MKKRIFYAFFSGFQIGFLNSFPVGYKFTVF